MKGLIMLKRFKKPAIVAAIASFSVAPAFAQTAAPSIDVSEYIGTLITKVTEVLPTYIGLIVDIGAFLLSVTLVFLAVRKVLGMIKGEAKAAN